MIGNGHAQGGGFGGEVAPDAAHAEDAEGFAEGVVAEGGGRCAAPGAGAEGEDGWVEVAEGGEEEEEGGVGGCGGEGGGRGVGDVDSVGGAGGDVDSVGFFFINILVRGCYCFFFFGELCGDGPGLGWRLWLGRGRAYVLVVSGAIVSDEAHTGFSECFDDFAFYPSCDGDTPEGAVDGFGAIEGAGVTFLEEVGRVGGFRGDEMGERGKGLVCASSWGTVGAFNRQRGESNVVAA